MIRRTGFTLIEVLVTISILCLLLCIMVPAVLSARKSSQKLLCTNSMNQIGIALSNYESSYKHYPKGANNAIFSAHVALLPYLGHTALYNSTNFSTGDPWGNFSENEANLTIGKTHVSVFCCPVDPDSSKGPQTNYAWNGGFGLQVEEFRGTFCSAATPNPVMLGPANITDGLSSTAALSEWIIGQVGSQNDSAVVFKVETSTDPNSYNLFVQKCLQSVRGEFNFSSWTKDARWVQGSYGSTLLNFNSTPQSKSCLYNGSIDFGNWPASSYHTTGVNLLFLDGHVSSVKNTIAIETWKALSSRAGNEILDTSSF